MACVPSARPAGEKDQVRLALAVAVVATALPSMMKWITAPGSAVPVKAGDEVILSIAELPVSLAKAMVTADGVAVVEVLICRVPDGLWFGAPDRLAALPGPSPIDLPPGLRLQ